jgi:hypothetical protein
MGNKIQTAEKKKKLTSSEMRKFNFFHSRFEDSSLTFTRQEEEGPHGPPQAW